MFTERCHGTAIPILVHQQGPLSFTASTMPHWRTYSLAKQLVHRSSQTEAYEFFDGRSLVLDYAIHIEDAEKKLDSLFVLSR